MMSPGWHQARVSLNDHSVEVTYDPQQVQLPEIASRFAKLGYRVTPWIEGSGSARYRQESRQRLVQIAIAGFCAMNAMWLAVGIYAGEHSGILFSHVQLMRAAGVMLGIIAAFGPGWTFFRGAWAAIKTSHTAYGSAVGTRNRRRSDRGCHQCGIRSFRCLL